MFLFLALAAQAQDDDEFRRIVQRRMVTHETTVRKQQSDYGAMLWHGGAYMGVSSNGMVSPSGFFTYKKGKVEVTGSLDVDVLERTSSSDVNTEFLDGAFEETGTDIMTVAEHQNLSLRLDYTPRKSDVFTVDIFQKYNHDRVTESSIKAKADATGDYGASEYEEQVRNVKDLNFGVLLQNMHTFSKAGSLRSRVYFKYDNKPTTVNSEIGAQHTDEMTQFEKQTYRSADPKIDLWYRTPVWNGWQFGVKENFALLRMSIDDTASNFDYDVEQSTTAAGFTYKGKSWSLSATGYYEYFHHTLKNYLTPNINHTYSDWLYDASADLKVNKFHSLQLSYERTIKRPTYTQLYPFVHIGSSIGAWVVGNSALQPSDNSQLKLTHTFKDSYWRVKSSVAYKRTVDDITKVSSYDQQAQRSVKTWVNDATYNILKFAVEGEMTYGRLNMTMGVHAQHLLYEGEKVKTDRAWSWSFKARPEVTLPKDWKIATVLLYTGREMHRHYYNRSNMYVSMRASKQLGDWAIYAFLQDVFEEKRVNVLFNSANTITTTDDLNARMCIIGCSYRF